MEFKDLIGRVIVSVTTEAGEVTIRTRSERNATEEAVVYKFTAEGDCCSSGWIGAVEVPDLPAKITKAEDGWSSRNSGSVERLLETVPVGLRYGEEGPIVQDGTCPRIYAASGQSGDCLAHYLYEIETDCGPLRMDIWNDSNGYYGSSVNVSEV